MNLQEIKAIYHEGFAESHETGLTRVWERAKEFFSSTAEVVEQVGDEVYESLKAEVSRLSGLLNDAETKHVSDNDMVEKLTNEGVSLSEQLADARALNEELKTQMAKMNEPKTEEKVATGTEGGSGA